MRRLIGLLMILALILPLFLGATTVVVAHEIVDKMQVAVNTRVDHINAKLNQVETTVNTVSARFEVLKNVADQVGAAANTAAQNVVNAINNFKIHYGGLTWPSWVPIPPIPPVDLDIPGMSAIRDFLQNLYNTLASLASAISDVTLIGQVPGQLGEAVTEVQGLYSDVNGIIAPYSQTLLILVVGLVIWMGMIYVVLVYRWLAQGWTMLLGRTA